MSIDEENSKLDDLSKSLIFLREALDTLIKANPPEVNSKLHPWMDAGFHPGEALHMSGVDTSGKGPTSGGKFEPSDSMMKLLQHGAKQHMTKIRDEQLANADAKHNPGYAKQHQSKKIITDMGADRDTAVEKFKTSGALEGMSGKQKGHALEAFITNYDRNNLDKNRSDAVNTSTQLADTHNKATIARENELYAQRKHYMMGGGSGVVDSSDLYTAPDVENVRFAGEEDLPDDNTDFDEEDPEYKELTR